MIIAQGALQATATSVNLVLQDPLFGGGSGGETPIVSRRYTKHPLYSVLHTVLKELFPNGT